MQQRVFICADVFFPRGDAGANRILYVAKALQDAGREVMILSRSKDKTDTAKANSYADVLYQNAAIRKGRFVSVLDEQIFGGQQVKKVLETYRPTSSDIMYLYASNSLFIYPLLNAAWRYKMKVCIDVVEWHQPFQYRWGAFDPHYIFINQTFSRIAPSIKNVIAISNRISDYYHARNCNVLVLPVIIDTGEQQFSKITRYPNKIRLCYPGNPCREDFVTMLKSIKALSKEQRDRLEFHITGVKPEKVRFGLKGDSYLLDELSDLVVFHGWLDYPDLVRLFQSMDFLFMSRPNDLVKQANFPSKLPEMMGWGIAPVGNRIGDYWKYLEDGRNAILFDGNGTDACKQALERIFSLSEKEICGMKENARKCAGCCFDYRMWSKKICNYMENLE